MYQPQSLSQSPETQAEEKSVSLIDKHSHFDGLYVTSHDLRIEGNAEGEIQCEGTVTIADAATVEAQIRARNVVLAGSAQGEILCEEQFTLQPSGKMRGRVRAASLVIEEGAFFEGEFQMGGLSSAANGASWFEQETAESHDAAPQGASSSAATPALTDSDEEEDDPGTDDEDAYDDAYDEDAYDDEGDEDEEDEELVN